MVSLDISDYIGFDILQKFERSWDEIRKNGVDNTIALQKMQTVLENVRIKRQKMYVNYNQFFAHTEIIHHITQTLDELAGDIGRLLGEFNNLEEILSLLESVCDEEEQVELIIKANEENHALRMKRQQEVEELKASLAKEHAAYLANLRRERAERKIDTEKAIRDALWETDTNQNKD